MKNANYAQPQNSGSKRATSAAAGDINASNDYIISVNAEKRGRSLSQNPYQRLIGRSAVTCPALPWPPYSYRCEARPHEQYVDRDNTPRDCPTSGKEKYRTANNRNGSTAAAQCSFKWGLVLGRNQLTRKDSSDWNQTCAFQFVLRSLIPLQ